MLHTYFQFPRAGCLGNTFTLFARQGELVPCFLQFILVNYKARQHHNSKCDGLLTIRPSFDLGAVPSFRYRVEIDSVTHPLMAKGRIFCLFFFISTVKQLG